MKQHACGLVAAGRFGQPGGTAKQLQEPRNRARAGVQTDGLEPPGGAGEELAIASGRNPALRDGLQFGLGCNQDAAQRRGRRGLRCKVLVIRLEQIVFIGIVRRCGLLRGVLGRRLAVGILEIQWNDPLAAEERDRPLRGNCTQPTVPRRSSAPPGRIPPG